MIARIWHGYTTPGDADAYEATLRTEILPGIKQVRGYVGCYILRRPNGDEVEFITILLWESMGALQAFAGSDYEAAIVPADRRSLLVHYDQRSAHYEVVVEPALERI